jgi:hypothetical protein
MPKQDLSTCPVTQHQFVITKWEVKTSERRIVRDDDTVEAETKRSPMELLNSRRRNPQASKTRGSCGTPYFGNAECG